MCNCCDNIDFLKQIYNPKYKFYAAITTAFKNSTTRHELYKLNYCPMCGKKVRRNNK